MAEGNGTTAGRTGNGAGQHSNGSGAGHAGTDDHTGFYNNPFEVEELRRKVEELQRKVEELQPENGRFSRISYQFNGETFVRQVDGSIRSSSSGGILKGDLIDGFKVEYPPIAEADLFKLIDPRTLQGLAVPRRTWVVPQWIPLKRVVALYGAPGEGKTLLAQMLATACALGVPWFPGLPTLHCNSILHLCEDDLEDAWMRQEEINKHYGCSYDDLGAMRWIPRLGKDNALMNFHNNQAVQTKLYEDLLAATNDHLAQLVIEDTLADVYIGNENDRAQVYQFGRRVLGRLALETGCCVMPLAHPSVRGIADGTGESGSTGWKGIFRAHLFLATPKIEHDEDGDPRGDGMVDDPNLRTLTRTKSNYAGRDENLDLRWQEGVFKSLNMPINDAGIIGTIVRRTCRDVTCKLVDKMLDEGQTLTINARSGNAVAKTMALRQKDEREGFRQKDFAVAIQALLKDEVLKLEPYGRGDSGQKRIIRGPKFPQPEAV